MSEQAKTTIKSDESEGFSLAEFESTKPELFNLKKEFTEQIQPLFDAVDKKCIELGIPYIFIAAEAYDAERGPLVHLQQSFVEVARLNARMLAARSIMEGDASVGLLMQQIDLDRHALLTATEH